MKNVSLILGGCLVLGSLALAQVAGGFTDADVKDFGVVMAAKFAVRTKNASLGRSGSHAYKLLEVTKAKVQVVAGLNYHLCFEVKFSDNSRSAEAFVYKDLRNKMTLNSWDWKACSMK
jgi:hypothetical protein